MLEFKINLYKIFLFIFQDCGLNSSLHACEAGALQLEPPHLQPF
jgi:hypothetical protein